MPDLFQETCQDNFKPLADRMRPQQLTDIVGQAHLLDVGKPLQQAINVGKVHSMIFWGPPGSGKTTLARVIANHCEAHFIALSAVLAGVKDIRSAIEQAKYIQHVEQRRSILFIDEVHRFNKAQQDAFLPHIEDGTVIFIGATTENPSFELNNALLSRARVYVLKSLSDSDLNVLLRRALSDPTRGLGTKAIKMESRVEQLFIRAADGDGRRLLNILEIAADLAVADGPETRIDETIAKNVLTTSLRRFDKQGEYFYDQISALHKSVRGSAPDAALYWLVRMLDGGCDPLYIARRLVRIASEDIGNADPNALTLTLNVWRVQEQLGSPEGELALAQAVVYLACVPKSNAVYRAFDAAQNEVRNSGTLDVPVHLRNAPTQLLKSLDYGHGYRYAHDEPYGYAAGERYLPEELNGRCFYQPTDNGFEKKIKERLTFLRNLDKQAGNTR